MSDTLPAGWRSEPLGALCEKKGEYGANVPKRAFDPELPRYIRITDINDDGTLNFRDPASITEEDAAPYLLRTGDVLIARSGATVGKAYLHNNSHGRFAYAGYLLRFRPYTDRLLPEYLNHSLHSSWYAAWVRDTQRAQAQPNINAQEYARLPIPLPPVPEQRKIAAILSAVNEVIAKTDAVIESLQILKKAMMQELLTRGLPGRHTKFKQTELGEIPEEWTLTTPGAVARFSGGHGFRPPEWSSSGLPIIRIQNLNGSTDFNYFDGAPEPEWIVEPGELLFAWAGSVGASFGPCVWPGPRGVLNQHIYRVSPGPNADLHYIYYLLKLITAEVERRAHGFKHTLVHLRKAELTDRPIPVPPLQEQREIVENLVAVEKRAYAEQIVLAAHIAVKAALMSVLLTGELRVTPDEDAA